MPKKAGRRIQIKGIEFQIKEALLSFKDPFPLLIELRSQIDILINNFKSNEEKKNELQNNTDWIWIIERLNIQILVTKSTTHELLRMN